MRLEEVFNIEKMLGPRSRAHTRDSCGVRELLFFKTRACKREARVSNSDTDFQQRLQRYLKLETTIIKKHSRLCFSSFRFTRLKLLVFLTFSRV